ncbi:MULTISPECIES: lipopolysaccharide biosynthesis protein [Marinobacter]|uniref:lipopolysaccharide biosynthesis protein n=1 Tax=Marinobacter TaxID=2742 RepID=UPI000C473A42|nr:MULTISPECIES: oligosaccharide flippase family protein [Marinobacter]MAO13085.1 polysaccharide biosynthesis protein [Marinobacter sp.]
MTEMPTPNRIQRVKDRAFSGPAGNVFRGMATLAAGNIAARLIGIAAIPVLTRLYSPEDFGVLAVLTSLVAILAPIISLRFVLAIPLPRRDGVAINLLVLSTVIMLGMILIASLVFWLFGKQLLGLFSMESLAPHWWLIIFGLIGVGGYEMLSLWATRRRAYKDIAQTTAIQSLIGNLIKLMLGFLAIKPLGLLIGQVLSSGGGVISLWLRFRTDFSSNRRHISIERVLLTAARYRHFVIFRLPSQFFLAFSTQSPLLFFSAVYGAHDTGQLSMALVIIALPLSVIGHSISQAYYAEVAKIGVKDSAQLIKITRIVTRKLFLMSIVPCLILMFGGAYIFDFFFGNKWSVSGSFASLLSIYLIAQFSTSPVMNVFNIINKQGVFLLINMMRAILMVLVFVVVAPYLSLLSYETVLLYSLVMAVFYVCIYLLVISQLEKLRGREGRI